MSGSPEKAQARKRAVKIAGASLLVIGLVVLLTTLTGTVADTVALRRLGIPMDEKDLKKLVPQTGENAAPLYQAAQEKLIEIEQGNRRSAYGFGLVEFYPGGPPRSEKMRIIEASKGVEPVADLFRQAATMQRCVLEPIDKTATRPEDKFERAQYGYSDLSLADNVLCGMAQAEMLQGRVKESLRDLGLARNVAAQFSQNPGSDAFKAWTTHNVTFYRNWRYCIQANSMDSEVIAGSSALVQQMPPMPNLRNVAAGDLPDHLRIYKEAQKDPFGYKVQARYNADQEYEDNKVLMRQAVNQMIHEWRLVFESMPKDPNDWQGFKAAFDKGADEIGARYPANQLLQNPFPKYARQCELWAVVLATHRLAVVSSELLKYRLEHKSLPSTLPDLGDSTIDPFTGEEFLYKKAGSGFVLTSLGRDGVDNQIVPPADFRRPDDIAFEFQ